MTEEYEGGGLTEHMELWHINSRDSISDRYDDERPIKKKKVKLSKEEQEFAEWLRANVVEDK